MCSCSPPTIDSQPSTSTYRPGLLPPFGLPQTAQLPTPQSPSNPAAYVPEFDGPYSSPVHILHRDAPIPAKTSIFPQEGVQASAPSFMTPESSPIFPRKTMRPSTPGAGRSSIPHTPVRRAHGHDPSGGEGSALDHATAIVTDTSVPLSLAPAPIISTPVDTHSRGLTPASRLSSPFQDTPTGPRTARSRSNSPVLANLPMDGIFTSPLPPTPLPLATPVPQRALGGEIQRIHLQLAAGRAERLQETEVRRPDYLVREKRPRSEAEIPPLDELDAADATLGVTDSPVKGRRLQLFQATSEETFEQSLLAGGYPGYGQSPAYKNGEPQTPVPNGKGRGALSQRALHWLHQATPGQPGPSTASPVELAEPEEPEWVPTEKDMRKRRRLDAFRDKEKEAGPKLYATEVEGRGRVLSDMPPEGLGAQPDTPVKRRVNRRKRRRGGRRGQCAEPQEDEVLQPNWPDAVFPWCMRAQERTHTEKMEETERLKWIERFLDRDSESDTGEDDQELRPPLQSHDNDQVAHRPGRGKMIPLRSNSSATRAPGAENTVVPSDPADARAALLSKRSVRSLAMRRRATSEDVEEVKCIGCRRGDDGSELVQCDECQTWYHLPCIGIKNVAELGREEDPWYCDRCLEIVPSSPLEPTFVPTDERALDPARRDSLFLQTSPAPHWTSHARTPQTPVRGSIDGLPDGATRTFSTRSSWGDSSRAGPSTPGSSARTVRVYTTPNPFAHDGFDPETPFDPTTTPSRGIQFSGGPPPTLGLSTPKGGVALWAGRGGQTPTPGPRPSGAGLRSLGLGGRGRASWDEGAFARSIYSAGYEDTPVTHAPRTRERLAGLSGRKLWETPRGLGEADEREREVDVTMEAEGVCSPCISERGS
ncbi:uncharacterized protein BXZ73DRAFT_53365 [Epithele typhae]|uniref:uncharacterized protein n=1 Tax=Epithele typhae TaxID=378194 RepID=UPI002007BB97|nr:uncharacterized protein BXZ73DRAFT_53365 [Epithele typhae]KAH9917392.1 hypothetical protein BXZ73DRAFT_53365 [Epithele typhae]